ncbi:MAG: alpha-galactosidase [Verrucomicrobia bacterium]|nr:alpha-galactosidase [Verrucomicrobiota bacterium]
MKSRFTTKNITIGSHTRIELLLLGEEFLGLGQIFIRGAVMRGRDVPLRPCLETPEGFLFNRLRLRRVHAAGGGLILQLDALGEPGFYAGNRIDYHYERVPAWATGGRHGTLEILLKPAVLDIDGTEYAGFSYQYVVRLKDARFHQLLDRATWEIGGHATGNIIVSQSQCCEPEHRCTLDSSFHTWVANARIRNNRDENTFLSYCFTPRFSSMQCFDFLDASGGSLVMFSDRLEHIKGSVFKESGQSVIHHCDLHSFALTNHIRVPAKFVLFHPTTRHADHEFRNRWTACRDFVYHRYQKQYGIREDFPRTEHHSWLDGECDHVFGHHIYPKNAQRWYYDIADIVIPAMKKMGFEKYFEGGLFKSLFTENPADRFFNFTILDYVISNHFGGIQSLRYLGRKCREHGILFELWLECGLHPCSPILRKHPEWVIHDPHLGEYAAASGFIRALDLNQDGAFAYVKERWTRLIRQAGVSAIFHDSFPNIGSMKINSADPLRRPQHRRLLELIRYFQGLGMEYAGEGGGPFVIQHGGLGSTDDRAMGECNYHWFRNREYSLYRTCRTIGLEVLLDGRLSNQDYFRLLANQAPLCIGGTRREPEVTSSLRGILKLGDEFARMQKAYNQTRLLMEKRTLLPDAQGVLWHNAKNQPMVCFTFKDIRLPVRGTFRLDELITGEKTEGRDRCVLKKHRVHLMRAI